MNKIEVGKIVNTRGLKGELKVIPYLDEVDAFETFSALLIDGASYEIEGVRYFKNNVLLMLSGIDTIEKAETLKNKILWVPESELPPLKEGEYYVKDLIGLVVETQEGEALGVIADVFKTGSNDVYTVKTESGKEIYLPAIRDVVKAISLEEKKVTVKLMEGLL